MKKSLEVPDRRASAEKAPEDIVRESDDAYAWKAQMSGGGRSSSLREECELREPRHPMFIDAAEMKERLKKNMIKPEYDVCNFYKTEGFCQLVARSTIFEHTTLAVIAFNAIWIAVDTDLNEAEMLLLAHPVFQIAEHFFCAYFTFEWTMRFGAFKIKRNGLRDAWFVFDSFMVVMMVAETWVMTAVLVATGSGTSSGGMGDASILRLLRLMRLSRMARMAKLLRSMPELLILIKGMLTAMKSVVYTLVLLLICIYLFAIAFRQLMAGTPAGALYFPSVFESMHTLLLEGTFMDSLGNVVRELAQESIAYVFVFYLFVCVGSLMVMNMLIGVLCEVVSAVAATERETIAVATVKDGFMEIIEKGGLDTDGDSMISRREFEAILNDPDSTRLLERVSVDVYGLVDLADFIFTQENDEKQEKQLTFTQFMEIVLSLRGNNNATVKDVVDLRKFIKDSLINVEEKLHKDLGLVTERVSRVTHCNADSYPGVRASLFDAEAGFFDAPACKDVGRARDEAKVVINGDHGMPPDVFDMWKAPTAPNCIPNCAFEANAERGCPSKAPLPHKLPSTKFCAELPGKSEEAGLSPNAFLRDAVAMSLEAPPAPPLIEELPLPPDEAPPMPGGLVRGLPPPTVLGEPLQRQRRLSCPDFEARTRMLREVSVKALRLEGVLLSARNEIGRFVEGMPIPWNGGVDGVLPGEPRASSSHDRHPPDERESQPSFQLMPSEERELEELRSRLLRVGQALQRGLEDLHGAQHRI